MNKTENSKQVISVEQTEKAVSTFASKPLASKAVREFSAVIDTAPKQAVELLAKQLDGATAESAVTALLDAKAMGKSAWIASSIAIAKAYENNAEGDKRKAFLALIKEKLGYSDKATDYHIKTGRLLIDGKYDKIPPTESAFRAMFKEKTDDGLKKFEDCTYLNSEVVDVDDGNGKTVSYLRVIYSGFTTLKLKNVPTTVQAVIVVRASADSAFNDEMTEIAQHKITDNSGKKAVERIVWQLSGKNRVITLDDVQALNLKF